MGILIPGWLRSVASVAVGQDWPECDETSLRRIADAWELAAVQIEEAGADGGREIGPALEAVTGIVGDAVAGKWQDVDESIDALVAACRQLADACEATAVDVEHAKLSIIAALVWLAAEIATLAAAAAPTFGASMTAVPAAEIATQATVRMILHKLIADVGRGIAVDGAISASLQAYQVHAGTRDRFDWAAFGKDLYGSAVGSAAGGGLGELPVARAVAGDLGTILGKKFGDGAVELVTGAIGAQVGEDAKAALSPPPVPGENRGGASSLNMN